MTLRQAWLPVTVALGGLTNGLIADDASAHVKWFCASNVRVWAKVCSAPWIGCSVTCSSKPS